jgi:SAM-dependent methyltransferase
MNQNEFDRFADEYQSLHAYNTRLAGEDPEFFAAYKIADAAERAPRARRILDFGCGVGNSIPFFRRHFPDADLTAVDVSRRSLNVAQRRFPEKASFIEFDSRTLPFPDAAFDLIFTACVFHHVPAEDHIPLFAEIRRCVSPEGRFVLFEHNPYNPLTVRAVNTCPFDENAILISPSTLRSRLDRAGFRNLQVRYRLFFPGPLKSLRPLERMMTWLPLGAQYSVDAFVPS